MTCELKGQSDGRDIEESERMKQTIFCNSLPKQSAYCETHICRNSLTHMQRIVVSQKR